MLLKILAVLATWGALVGVCGVAARAVLNHAQVRRRLIDRETTGEADDVTVDPLSRGPLTRWLYLAGFRSQRAASGFLLAMALAVFSGLTTALVVYRSGILKLAARSAADMPGGLGSLAQPILRIAPWLLLAILGTIPFSIVRRARRRRVAQVERDLPITLELLATLAEAGIGFDAAIGRVLDSQSPGRALVTDLRTLQAELLAGRTRVDCLRRVARRLDVISVTIFISAIVQAEQIGSGVAGVLRQQADDLRQRRRERALEFSMSLPVKQMFPLVICFLPGILVYAIGPLFAEFLKYAGTFGGR
jgi:tight adherence protein C